MIVSVNWLRQFTQIDLAVDELAAVIGARLVEIEGVRVIGEKYKDVVVARVVECAPVEDSDHLNLTRIDDGGAVQGVERGDDGLVQVVCGAPNVRAGMLVAWLPPGSTVPDSFGDEEPFVLGARKLRGFMSNGMLASARELDLFDDHDGIVEVDKDVAPGTPFMDAYALDDALLEVENKSLTHRPDTFGVVGFAREVAAIAGKGFTAPVWLETAAPAFGEPAQAVALDAVIDDERLSHRYQVVALGGFDPQARTPLEIQTYLARSGVRPISPIVDVTNYLMLLTGQPLHAFDYDKVVALAGSAYLHVREGHADETLRLLDGRTVAVAPDDIVIAAGAGTDDRAVALAGAMGGADTEIDQSTTRIILESATFDLYRLRRTGMRHGIFSEALTRFTKGQPAALTAPVLARAVELLGELCGAKVISGVVDAYPVTTAAPTLSVPLARINGVLGTRFSVDDVVETFRNVEFDVDADGETLSVTPPYWRTDISIIEDLIEEVGRLNGFDSVEAVLPRRDMVATEPDAMWQLKSGIRTLLAGAGANEVLTYSFVHGDQLTRAGQDPTLAFALGNALSPDLQYYRLSLTPSLLALAAPNLRQKFDEFGLFEFGQTHVSGADDPAEPGLPAESPRLGFLYAASEKRAAGRGSAYYTAVSYVRRVLDGLHVDGVVLVPVSERPTDDIAATPFEPKRSAAIYAGDTYIGIIGEYKRAVALSFKLPAFSAGFELLLGPLAAHTAPIGTYTAPSRFPASDADITFAVPAATAFGALAALVAEAAGSQPLRVTFVTHDMYAPDGAIKNVTFRFTITATDRTLTRDDVNAAITSIGDFVTAADLDARIV